MTGLTKQQKAIVFGSWLGWSLDGYDLVLMLLVTPLISILFFPAEDPTFSLLATFAAYTVVLMIIATTGFGPIPVFLSERFPTEIRNSASGFIYNGGLIFGSWAPLIAIAML
ncbi:hypothetical protein [Nitrosopumilus sp.]|uniref:hypothetical protein n=1 Tax=Nitrosopumilus sp. TaxID=2024843 RepID=UPI0026056FAB|nr:hypothetical protein [Nitrosopumilus sp.]